jgi:NADP-dependent 3-hydroxy acid dehydrogenase YdfG
MKTIAILGAGPGLGLSIARCFGRAGFNVGLIARSSEKLRALQQHLAQEHIESASFAADVTDTAALDRAVRAVEDRFGRVDVIELSPMPAVNTTVHVRDATRADVMLGLEYSIFAAVTAVRAALPGMLERKEGGFLFTTGASSVIPLPSHGSGAAGQAALRNYAYLLNEALRDDGIYAGTVTVANIIAPGGVADPDRIAATYWDMYSKRDRVEETFGDPSLLPALERKQGKQIARGDMDRALAAHNVQIAGHA